MSKPFCTLFALSIILVTCHAQTLNTSTTCEPSKCGNLNISYPFWKKSNTNVQEFCGYPEFGLECLDDQAILILPTNRYQVTDINYDNHSITLIDIDVLGQPCPRARHNVSLHNLPLSFSSLDFNLSFYFNCSSYPSSIQHIGCMKHDKYQSYVFKTGDEAESNGYDWLRRCEEHVVVTVKKDEIEISGLITGFGDAMQKGFVLDWMRAQDCAVCEESNGYCRFDQATKQSRCLCSEGRTEAKSCKKAITTGVMGGFMICIIICCTKCMSSTKVKLWFTLKNDQRIESFLKHHGALAQKRYKFSEVKKMTNSFKVKLGEGGFGAVYKGELLSGCPVAVKILNASKGNGEEFINEVASISRTSHVNIVTLLGFSLEGRKKALIYEFMPNGSLDKFIYNKGLETTASLSWDNLWQIAIGIARGLEYLHSGCNTRILHFDIKPHNILLDENLCPKISDFGLAKLFPRKDSIVSLSYARGTIGYVAPEVCNKHFGGISHKSDVYSYGMMLLEMVGVKKNINAETSQTSEYFPDWIYKRLEQGRDLTTDGVIATQETEIARKMTIVGLWCVQTIPQDRPTMSKVIEMLEGNMNSLEMPPKSVLSSPARSVPEFTTSSLQSG
ncbi:LEAF RUST 10 DISEASE-RESISTANCE LOCUS RECEPTOR-LIKE PROTEIN KINASE-like 2.1 isoform X2 [Glycine soja]|uniref:LEAF RUST 10 DISEASE-RESISTANCE LOCUS RECEPTOR-LIKE PROTEIN KINASE-like 2.1 isoform X2 n=1 Tax=Glycine soja TaxID=3848 RepID=UPI00103985FD|nr:LEAF RUST 10 DISEASE-RESISTANCE LOCUS RECEPTOR-LIKE PROTEIN KINASE-like 2.1 isoform X2 [Glycine soja]